MKTFNYKATLPNKTISFGVDANHQAYADKIAALKVQDQTDRTDAVIDLVSVQDWI